MNCEERERLSLEYRNAVRTLTERALAQRERTALVTADKHKLVELALRASAQAQVALREHMDEHRCWTHSESSLLRLWQSPPLSTDRNAKATAR
jgi:hypothetical protein